MVKPGYKQTEVGLIPEDWEIELFEKVTKRTTVGIACSATHAYCDDGVAMMRNQNIKPNYLDEKDVVQIEYEFANKFSSKALREGDLLTARTGYPGTTCVVPQKYAGAQSFTTLISTPDTLKANSSFLSIYMNSQYGMNFFAGAQIGGAQKNVNAHTLASMPIMLPSLHEQKRIVECISTIDGLIRITKIAITKKKLVKQGAMQELLTGKKRLPGFSGEWINFNLMKHSKIKARIGWQGLKKSEYLDSGYALLITGTDFDDGKVQWDSCHYVTRSRYDQDRNIQIQNNDILITKDGSLGKAALVLGLTKPATLNSGIFVIRPMQNAYDPVFVYHILSSFVFKDFLDKLSAGSTIIHLYQKDVGKFEFGLPPTIEEQEAIAALLSEMDSEIEALQQKLEKYRQIKQGMMQQLLTGKIRLV